MKILKFFKKHKGIISNCLIVLVILILNYPIFADVWNAHHSSYMSSKYLDIVNSMDKKDYDSIIYDAEEYNYSLYNNPDRLKSEKTNPLYNNYLDINGTGILAYITVPTAGVYNVPVYHGIDNAVLQIGAGHMPGSSLPSNAAGIHTVISGHSGMSGMKMFSQLPEVKVGDSFQVMYLNRVLFYTVVKIQTVLPSDSEPLKFDGGRNFCSLITCTPLGINSHRLIVTGELEKTATVNNNSLMTRQTNTANLTIREYLEKRFARYELIMSGFSILVFILFLIPDFIHYLIKKYRKRGERIEKNK